MAESLGEALLVLRTDDGAFNTGVQQAEGKAQRLGAQLDRTSGSSAKLAGDMQRAGQGVLVLGRNFEIAGQKVTASAGAQRQGMQQLGFQLGDIATMYSLGARPAQIFASQIGQVTQAVQLMAGGTSRVAAFLGGPWGIALSVGVIALTPFIAKLFEAEDALEGVEFASDRLGDAQGILGRVIDETTGKVNAQSQAMLALARAQAAAGMVGAMQRQAAARSELTSISQGGLGDLRVEGTMGGLRVTREDGGQRIVELFRSGRISGAAAEQQLRARMESGLISREAYFRAAQAITSYDVEGANVAVFRDTLAGLDGDSAAALRVLGPSGDRSNPRSRRSGPDQAAIDARFESDLVAITQQILRARLQVATSAEERAELEARGVEWDRREALAAIAAREGLDDVQRAELEAATNRLADAELEAIEFNKRLDLAREAQALADERFRGEAEALQIAGDLADTEAERRDIALRLYDAQVEMERLALQTIVDMAARGEIEKREGDLAAQRLANLERNAAGGRAALARQNETGAERYLRGINATSGQINEAIDGISIDGLESLNDGLTRAIMGAESLGDVFSRVADQIIADLLRIAIQQAIIRPLANSLFGGMGGGESGGGVFGSLFSGFFAEGGTIPTGKFGIVGEEGPELAFAGPGGLGILSNSDSKALLGGAGGPSISIPISIDATGADAAAIARLKAKLDQLRAELPGTIISTVQDASNRRIVNLGGGR